MKKNKISIEEKAFNRWMEILLNYPPPKKKMEKIIKNDYEKFARLKSRLEISTGINLSGGKIKCLKK